VGAWTGPPAMGAHPTSAKMTKSAASETHKFITSSGLPLIQRAYPRPAIGWSDEATRSTGERSPRKDGL